MKTYRLLNPGETIQAADECFSIAQEWVPVPEAGKPFNPKFHSPVRREAPALSPEILRNYKRLLRSLETEAANGGFPYKETIKEARETLAGVMAAPVSPDVPPGALAALVDAARDCGGFYGQTTGYYHVPPEARDRLRAALAPFTPAPDPAPVSPRPYGYAVKANSKGYLAIQGREAWFETEPVGWAVFGTEDHARAMLEENHSMIGTATHEGGEIVPVYR